MIPKQLAAITLADIEELAANSIPEGRTLEYKAQLPKLADDGTREFLHDVTSLANTDGGDLIFGVEDKAGVAKSAPGAPLVDTLDATILRLENLLRDCVQPRLVGVRFHPLETAGGAVIILRIPASFAAPHRAYYKGVGRFYHRNSRGKAEMDVHELRAAFAASEGLTPRLIALHEDAVKQVTQGDLPFELEDGARAILSILPLSILREPAQLDPDHTTAVFPNAQGQGLDWLRALDGFYVFGVSDTGPARAYALTRRSGQVDVSWRAGRRGGTGERIIWPQAVEETINGTATGAAAKLGAFGVEGPFAVAFTLLKAKGYRLHRDFFSGTTPAGAWRDIQALPLLVVDNLQPESLLPLAKTFWLAMGEKRPDGPLGKVT